MNRSDEESFRQEDLVIPASSFNNTADPSLPTAARDDGSGQDVPLSVYDMTVAYHRKPVIWDVSFDLPGGELIGIVGPNGAEKARC